MGVIPTRSLPQGASRLLGRQATATVTVVSQPDGATTTSATPMSAGAIAGIVIGTIAGILLIWWIISACTGNNARNQQTLAAPAVRERSPRGHRHSHGHYYVEESRPSRSRSRRRSGSVHVHAPARVYTADRSPRASYGGGRSPARVYAAQPEMYDDYDQRPRRSSRY